MSRELLDRAFLRGLTKACGESWCQGLSPVIEELMGSQSIRRRGFLGASSFVASVLMAKPSGLRVEFGGGRIVFILGGCERWVIDENYFGGSPRVHYVENNGNSAEVSLADATLPGTQVRAD